MGGNCLKETFTRRYQADEYKELCAIVNRKLYSHGYMAAMHIIDAYRTKESFGDMDVLYTTYDDLPLCVEDIADMFSNEPPNQIVRNGSVISFDFREFQIDFIHSPQSEFMYAKNYFAWNDIGNLIGKITRRFGLKHGHNGLILPLRDGDHAFDEVVMTYDHDQTLRLIELDPERFNVGFDTLDDIFEYVSSSPYFNPESYKLENVSHAGRVRDKKRKTYQEFLKFIEEREGTFNVLQMPSKELMVPHVLSYFDKWGQFNSAVAGLAVQKQAKLKFNGELVSTLTGLEGKDLGMFMRELRQTGRFEPEYMVYLSDENIRQEILSYYAGFRQ